MTGVGARILRTGVPLLALLVLKWAALKTLVGRSFLVCET